MKTEKHLKSWGAEIWLVNSEKYCGKILIVEKDKFCSLHAHKLKDETFFVELGSFEITTCSSVETTDSVVATSPKVVKIYKAGDVLHVPPLLLHRFKGLEDENRLIEISTQHFEDDSYRVEPSYKQG